VYFKESRTILVRLLDLSILQSSNEGYTWDHLFPEETFLAFHSRLTALDANAAAIGPIVPSQGHSHVIAY
jgi:hypothetical protein